MSLVAAIVVVVLNAYIGLLLARIVLSLVAQFARSWTPRGIVLLFVEFVFTATDPPITAMRRLVPPLRIGAVALDVAFILVFLIVSLLRSIAASFIV